MKIIITENKFKDTIKLSLNEFGTESTIDNVGGWDNFCNVMNIEGTGLGLTITKEFTQKLGGDISFTSQQDKGSTFILRFPYRI